MNGKLDIYLENNKKILQMEPHGSLEENRINPVGNFHSRNSHVFFNPGFCKKTYTRFRRNAFDSMASACVIHIFKSEFVH